MNSFFENNLILFLSAYIVAYFAWKYSIKLKNVRVRRATRASILFLFFPVIEISHPFIFDQNWMALIVCTYQVVPKCLIILSVWWLTFLVLSQVRIPDKPDKSKN
jgi:hypothetical protein